MSQATLRGPKLKEALLGLKDRYIPRVDQSLYNLLPPNWKAEKSGFKATLVRPEEGPHQDKLKGFLLQHFYPHHPNGSVLNFGSQSNAIIRDYVQLELSTFLSSGLAMEIVNEENGGQIVGGSLTGLWPRDDRYRHFPVRAIDWHNTGAEIAMEESPQCPQPLWRRFCLLHYYHMNQMMMKKLGLGLSIWAFALTYKPEARGSGITEAIFGNLHRSIGESNHGVVIGTQSNFPAFDNAAKAVTPRSQFVDEVLYKDEKLTVDGERVFMRNVKLNGTKYFIGYV